jgi:RND family efflux transporter MFP subunit
VFIPKPTQRLLEVRTKQLVPETARRAVHLIGRVIADPNRTSLVQSINGGRVIAPEAGLPRIGMAVKKGDLLAQIEPSFPLADRTTIAERVGEVEQLIAVAESKLRRARQLAERQVVAQSQVIDAEIELDGLRRRREALHSTRAEPEILRASTSGVIAAARVVPGQVVQAQDILFQIVDPGGVWVEALVYGDTDPAALAEATAAVPGGQTLTLRFQGFSPALRQHATAAQFAVENASKNKNLGIGRPVTVVATSGDPVTALIVPRDAVVRSANGESIVWRHVAPERFEPRPVRTAPLDASRVILAAGVSEGDRIVVRAADLVNQVR